MNGRNVSNLRGFVEIFLGLVGYVIRIVAEDLYIMKGKARD